MKAYLFAAKLRIQTALAYRFDILSTIFVQCIVMFAISFFWIAAYGGDDSVLDVSRKSMLTYTTISILMGNMLTMNVQHRIVDSVKNGNVAVDMLKPVSIYGLYLAEDIGDFVLSVCQKVIPLFVISTIMFGLPKPSSAISLILFLISFVFAYFINWLLAALLGMCAFQTLSMGAMMAVKSYIIKLLSGSIIPLWFFPHELQVVLELLPFVSIYQLPLGIYIGKYTLDDILPRMGIQLSWVLILLIIFNTVQKKMADRVLIQGG
ncbi:MAG: ABC-2 family transporter protein [Bacillota bacterium]|nr:ABC-2 family transporter protein [Bacillota bacterium]